MTSFPLTLPCHSPHRLLVILLSLPLAHQSFHKSLWSKHCCPPQGGLSPRPPTQDAASGWGTPGFTEPS